MTVKPNGQDLHPFSASATEAEQASAVHRFSRCLALKPYLLRYKGMIGAALVALIVSAAATLVLPLAVRRMIDVGFSGMEPGLVDKYFATLLGVGLILALASAARFYFVNWLGERVVADIRTDIFKHLTGLSPAFYETAHSGEVMSRLTADTTQVKAAASTTISQALRNIVILLGAVAMMIVTSPRLSLAGADRHSADRAAALCLWTRGALAVARGARQSRACLGLCERELEPGAGAASLHP